MKDIFILAWNIFKGIENLEPKQVTDFWGLIGAPESISKKVISEDNGLTYEILDFGSCLKLARSSKGQLALDALKGIKNKNFTSYVKRTIQEFLFLSEGQKLARIKIQIKKRMEKTILSKWRGTKNLAEVAENVAKEKGLSGPESLDWASEKDFEKEIISYSSNPQVCLDLLKGDELEDLISQTFLRLTKAGFMELTLKGNFEKLYGFSRAVYIDKIRAKKAWKRNYGVNPISVDGVSMISQSRAVPAETGKVIDIIDDLTEKTGSKPSGALGFAFLEGINLSPVEKISIEASFYWEASQETIGRSLGVSRVAVQKYIKKGLAKIRRAIGPCDFVTVEPTSEGEWDLSQRGN